jgi:hypothetical protein
MTKAAGAAKMMVMLSNIQTIEYTARGTALSHQVTIAYLSTAKGVFEVVSSVLLLRKMV